MTQSDTPPTGPTAGSPPPIRVVIVEDDHATSRRLAAVVDAQPDLRLSGVAATLAEAHSLLSAQVPDVLLTDIGLPDGSGMDLIRRCHRDTPGVDVMVITVFGDESTVLCAIEAGATGYLLKDGRADDIADSIRQLHRGGSPISPAIARHVLRRFASVPGPVSVVQITAVPAEGPVADSPGLAAPGTVVSALPPHYPDATRLTPKEVQVLQLLAKGFSYGEIAASLAVTVHTVTTHIKHIYRKLAVRSRGEAVFEAVQLGLIRVERHDLA